MNRRKAKKAVKKKWHIKKWHGNIDPRTMNKLYKTVHEFIKRELERAILYGDRENNKAPIGLLNYYRRKDGCK